jgi:lipopolysaccharide/colanic/teichoic acid biosynthesis glycosyltransferase
MARRVLDIAVALLGLIILAVPLVAILALVWSQDWRSPFYRGVRAGRGGGEFRMVKIRSMTVGADRTGVESTGANDMRITPIGHFIRRFKLDELPQLWNVLVGDMSLVGPRPNTLNSVATYTAVERELLTVRPGITDLSSIVFSDEGEIIKDATDPDAAYDRLIRPWKSELGLLYVRHASVALNLRLIWLTVVTIVDKQKALRGVVPVARALGASELLLDICRRERDLSVFSTLART